jgi:hypothetical protein
VEKRKTFSSFKIKFEQNELLVLLNENHDGGVGVEIPSSRSLFMAMFGAICGEAKVWAEVALYPKLF